MNVMRKYISILVLTMSFLTLSAHEMLDANEAFVRANEQYAAGDFGKAAFAYQAIIEQYGESAQLYYNMGNAHYKDGSIGLSILSYERALRLCPFYADARYNLKIAQNQIVDKIEQAQQFFIMSWVEALMSFLPTNTWTWVGAMLFCLFLLQFFVFAFARRMWLRKLGFTLGLTFFSLSAVCMLFALATHSHFEQRKDAIVMSGITTVRSSPDVSGTDLYVIHEGTKVTITETVGEWHEVKFGNANVGWVEAKTIERI